MSVFELMSAGGPDKVQTWTKMRNNEMTRLIGLCVIFLITFAVAAEHISLSEDRTVESLEDHTVRYWRYGKGDGTGDSAASRALRARQERQKYRKMTGYYRLETTEDATANSSNNLYAVSGPHHAEVQCDYEEEAKRLNEEVERAEEKLGMSYMCLILVILIISPLALKTAGNGTSNKEVQVNNADVATGVDIGKPESVKTAIGLLHLNFAIMLLSALGIYGTVIRDRIDRIWSASKTSDTLWSTSNALILIGLCSFFLFDRIDIDRVSAGESKARTRFSMLYGTLIAAFIVAVALKVKELPVWGVALILVCALMLLLAPLMLLWTPKASEWFKKQGRGAS